MTNETLPTAEALADPRAAIDFALRFLPSYETADFLRDWRGGADLKPWLDAIAEDQQAEG